MKLLVKRLYRKDTYTIGKLYINGQYFCDTLEDKDRGLRQDMSVGQIEALKVKKETAIPIGKYKIRLSMSPRLKRVLPELILVKGYIGVRIHSGNSHIDTEGCILVGKNTQVGKVLNSRYWETKLMTILNGQTDIEIEITY